MVKVKKSKIQFKRLAFILVIVLIAYKSYQHFKPRDLISIIDQESILTAEKVNVHRYDGVASSTYNFDIYDKEDIQGIINLVKGIKFRRYYVGSDGVRYDGHIDKITFNNNKSIVLIEIIGNKYIYLHQFPKDIDYKEYVIIGDIDTSFIDNIIDKKNVETITDKTNHSLSLFDIYKSGENAYWDYVLQDGTHMYKQILSKKVKEDNVKISMNYVSDPIDDRGEFVERIKKQEIEITSKEISVNNTVVLKAPLEKGNSWRTNIQLFVDGTPKTYDATVTIEEVTDKIITTHLVVSDLMEFKDNKYIRTQTYQKNFGLIYECYNDKDGLKHETKLERVYRNVIHDFIDPKEFMKFNDLEVIDGNI